MPTMPRILVSLMMVTNSLHMAGRMLRTAWGRITWRIAFQWLMPMQRAASIWPPGTAPMPERMTSDI